jgi:hypothetical protein
LGCALYIRCAVSIHHKGCGKVWGARYTLGARYLPKNTVVTYIKLLVFLFNFSIANFGYYQIRMMVMSFDMEHKDTYTQALCIHG